MLTQPQIELHWNFRVGWAHVCQANSWYMSKGRMDPEAATATCSQWHRKVWAFAELFARKEGRAVTPDDLRKGCYTLVLGQPKSLTKFENADLDRVLICFRLMAEPDDLKAVGDFLAYEKFDKAKAEIARCRQLGIPCDVALPDDPGERRRHLASIKKLPQAVVLKICRDRFHSTDYESFSMEDLRALTRTLKNRRDYSTPRPVQRELIQQQEPLIDADNIPF